VTDRSWEESDLSIELQRLREGLETTRDALGHALDRLDDLDDEAVRTRDGIGAVETRAADAEVALRDLSGLLKRLDARVEWLERNIRLSESAPVVELDDVHPGLIRLAADAESGLVEEFALLAAPARDRLQQEIDRHARAGRQHAGQLQAALAASLSVAHSAYPGEEHAGAVTDTAAAARQARQLLAQDDARREEVTDRIAAGRQAQEQLVAVLRRRLADAVGEGALLPTWFTTVLGPIPPADDTREWMDTGTDLLAYRVSYQVSDPVVALGFEPSEADSARRREWHHRLKRLLR
jgi:hypothetical protein